MENLTLDTGRVQINLIDTFGEEIGTISFSPTDTDIVNRFEDVKDFLGGITFDESETDKQTMETLRAADAGIRKQMDYLFSAPVSDVIFSKCAPMTILDNGNFYVEEVVEGLGRIIGKVMGQRLDKKREKISNATKGYRKNDSRV